MTARGSLSLSIDFPRHSPFFRLADTERIEVEHALIRQMLAHFPSAVQKSWGSQQFAVAPDHCVENEARVRQFAEERLADLPGGSFALATTEPYVWICRVVENRHVCERVWPLLLDGAPWTASQASSMGLVYAPVLLTLAWESRLPQPWFQD